MSRQFILIRLQVIWTGFSIIQGFILDWFSIIQGLILDWFSIISGLILDWYNIILGFNIRLVLVLHWV